ncbi:hypothetical protein STA3757_43090 [Stanieria sp. NIES-3757]|nr:hypothetical protein STA3757_43090 [Stanieria sp. NIES-3757]
MSTMLSLIRFKVFSNNRFNHLQWFLMYIFSRFNTTSNLAISLYLLDKSKNFKSLPASQPEQDSLFPNLNPNEIVKRLRKDGFAPGIELSQQNVENILNFIKQVDCFPDHDGPKDIKTGISLSVDGFYSNKFSRSRYDNTFQDCPTIQAIINDPKLLKIATDYLQVTPIYMGARLWWSHADAPPYDFKRAGQVFHYDIDDYRALRFFFYLTDVDKSCGPHVIIRGSHTHKKWRDKLATSRFRTDSDLSDFYGKEKFIHLFGKSGFGFAEDPKIFHKGVAPESQDRLILLIRYSMNDFFYSNNDKPQLTTPKN